MASLGGRNHLCFSAGRQAVPRGTRGRGAAGPGLGGAQRRTALLGASRPPARPGTRRRSLGPLVGAPCPPPVCGWFGPAGSRAGFGAGPADQASTRRGAERQVTASRAPRVANGFRPGVRETPSAGVGLVLGHRAEWMVGWWGPGRGR